MQSDGCQAGYVGGDDTVVTSPAADARGEISEVERCLIEIRAMVLSGELLPGQKITQGALADQLQVSRIPVREALATLQAEGVLVHKPNSGFTVARFSSEDLSEIYLMRRLLETELLKSIDLATVDIKRMQSLCDQMAAAGTPDAPDTYQRLNTEFHFVLFDASPLELVRQELARLWYMSGFYRLFYLYQDAMFPQLQRDHQQIISAVKSRNLNRLIEIVDKHRTRAPQSTMVRRLGHRGPALTR